HLLRKMVVEYDPANRSVQEISLECNNLRMQNALVIIGSCQINHITRIAVPDGGQGLHLTSLKGQQNFLSTTKSSAFAFGSPFRHRQVIATQYDVLSWDGDRHTVGR